jgi:hypothetical protein
VNQCAPFNTAFLAESLLLGFDPVFDRSIEGCCIKCVGAADGRIKDRFVGGFSRVRKETSNACLDLDG